jgi:RimJ/RimL family protein N-acetyltransferase
MPGDILLLEEALEQSLEHLKPWIPWVHDEPMAPDDRLRLLRSFRGRFDLDEDFIYAIFDREERRVLGGTGLHTRRGRDVREIGYWIRQGHTNQGLATESTAALVRVAFEIDQVKLVEIRCDPKNDVSAAIPRKLGFTEEGLLRHRSTFQGQPRDDQVWSLLREEYPGSPASRAEIQAYDVLGGRIL